MINVRSLRSIGEIRPVLHLRAALVLALGVLIAAAPYAHAQSEPELDWLDCQLGRKQPASGSQSSLSRAELRAQMTDVQWGEWIKRLRASLQQHNRWGVPESARNIDRILRETTIDRDYDNIPLPDVLADLSQAAGVPIKLVIPPNDTRKAYVELIGPMRTHTGKQSVAQCLDDVCEVLSYVQYDSGYWVGSATVYVGESMFSSSPRTVVEYDLKPIVNDVFHFGVQPPTLKRNSTASPSTWFDPTQAVCDQVISLIRDTYVPDQWLIAGGDHCAALWLDETSILIDADARLHLRIERYLDRLIDAMADPAMPGERVEFARLIAPYDELDRIMIPCAGQTIPLNTCIELITKHTGLPVDARSMEMWGVDVSTMIITLPVAPVSARALLDIIMQLEVDEYDGEIIADSGRWAIDCGRLEIIEWGVPTHLIIYDINDLATAIQDDLNRLEPYLRGCVPSDSLFTMRRVELMDLIADEIRDRVDPDGWRRNGGDTSHIQFLGPKLLITTPVKNHIAIDALLLRMRTLMVNHDDAIERAVLDHIADSARFPADQPILIMRCTTDLIAAISATFIDPQPGAWARELQLQHRIQHPVLHGPDERGVYAALEFLERALRRRCGYRTMDESMESIYLIQPIGGWWFIHATPDHHRAIDELLTRLEAIFLRGDHQHERALLDACRDPAFAHHEAPITIIHDIHDLALHGAASITQPMETIPEASRSVHRKLRAMGGIINRIEDAVDPESWDREENPASITPLFSHLMIETTPEHHLAIAELLEQMRAERNGDAPIAASDE